MPFCGQFQHTQLALLTTLKVLVFAVNAHAQELLAEHGSLVELRTAKQSVHDNDFLPGNPD